MVEELVVAPGSQLDGSAIRDLRGTRTRVEPDEVAVVGLKRRGEEMVASPPVETVLHAGDIIILWGAREARRALTE
jgi:Trk K+ transport system NAD-binding subunit